MINSIEQAMQVMKVKELSKYDWEVMSLLHDMAEEFMEEHSDEILFERVGLSLNSYPKGFSDNFLLRYGEQLPLWEISQRQEIPNILRERFPEKFHYRLVNGLKISTEKIKKKKGRFIKNSIFDRVF